MALTKISTDGVQDDAITKSKIPANQIEASELADNSVDSAALNADCVIGSKIADSQIATEHIVNEAVTLSKLEHGTSSNNGKFLRANNGADPTFETINTTPADGSIPEAKLANNAVTHSKIADTAISQAKLNYPVSNRNLIINGAMQICQRFNANSMNNISGNTHTYHVDRFKAFNGNGGILGQEWQPNHAPAGYYYSLRLKCVSADTSIDNMTFLSQVIEDKNIYNLHYGSSSAVTCTLSFWIKSNLTGTYSIGLINDTQGSRGFVAEYTINTPNTWEKKSITIAGDTAGTWNAGGLRVHWALAIQSSRHASTLNAWQNTSSVLYSSSNQPNFMGNTNNYMNITGVQFEVGSNSTEFDHKTITEDQRLCERYYVESLNGGIRNAINNNGDRIPVPAFRTQMRASPTMIASNFTEFSAGSSRTITGFHGVGSNGGGYAQLNSTPSNGVYFFAHANAEL